MKVKIDKRHRDKRTGRVLVIILLSLLVLIFLPSAFADYLQNWDGFDTGTLNPTGWNKSSDLSGITTPTYAACFGASPTPSGITNLYSHSPANSYLLSVASSSACFATPHYINLTAMVNATGPSIFLRFYVADLNASFVHSVLFNVYLCGNLVPTLPPSADQISNGFMQFNSTVTAGPCSVTFQLQTTISTPQYIQLFFDDITIKAANIILPGANLFLVDEQSHKWFNISDYPLSSVSILYSTAPDCVAYGFVKAGSTVCQLNDVIIPDMNITLLNAKLITVHVGSAYYRTVIPLTASVNVYLSIPSKVGTYAVTINDLSGTFGAGSNISISSGVVLTSGSFDHSATFTAGMVPGVYNTTIRDHGHSFITTLTFGTQSAISINIGKFSTSGDLSFLGTATYGFVWNCNNTHLISTFLDPTNTTTTVKFTVWNQTSITSFIIDTQTFTPGPFGTVTWDLTGINTSQGSYRMNMSTIDGMGTHATGFIYVVGGEPSCPNSRPGVLGGLLAKFDFPASVFGLDQFTNMSWDGVFSLFLITLTAGVFGTRQSKFGFVVVGFEAMFLFFALLLPPLFGGYIFYYSMIGIAIIGFLRFKSGPFANFLPALVVFSIILNITVPFANAMGVAGGSMPFDPAISIDTLLNNGAGCNRMINGTVTCTTDFGNLGILGGFAAFGNFVWAIIKLLLFIPTVIFLPGVYMVSIFYAPLAFAALYNIGFVAIFVLWLAGFIANRQSTDTG